MIKLLRLLIFCGGFTDWGESTLARRGKRCQLSRPPKPAFCRYRQGKLVKIMMKKRSLFSIHHFFREWRKILNNDDDDDKDES